MKKNNYKKVIQLCGLQIMLDSDVIFRDNPCVAEMSMNDVAISIKCSTYVKQDIPLFIHIYGNDIYISESFMEIRYNNISLVQANITSKPWMVVFNTNILTDVCEELFVKIVIPYYFYTHNAGIPLHATTVKHGKDIICIMGESYSGKSTLAYYLLQDENFILLSDDVTPISLSSDANKQIVAFSGSNNLKIRKETASFFSTNTLLFSFPHTTTTQGDLVKCIFFINPHNEEKHPSLRLCSNLESRCLLLKNLYASYLYKLDESIIKTINAICDKIKIYELNYFKDFSQLSIIKNLLITQVEAINE